MFVDKRIFQLQREMAEVKMAAVTSMFVYIARKRQDIIGKVISVEFMSLTLIVMDSLERPRKFHSCIFSDFLLILTQVLPRNTLV